MREEQFSRKRVAFGFALFILADSFSIILIPSLLYRVKVQPLFFLSWAVCILLLRWKGYSFETLQNGMTDYCKKAVSPILILFCSGAMIGVWNQCGTIPFMTVAGASVIRAEWYLPISFFLSLFFAFLTGTVFGACGTVGVVFLAIGRSMGIPAQLCIGVNTAGAFLGYGLSPAADCTNIAASLAGVELGRSIRRQGIMTVPVILFCGGLYTVINQTLPLKSGTAASTQALFQELASAFQIGWPALIPLLTTAILLIKRQPTVISLMSGSLTGAVVSICFQHSSLQEVIQAIWEGSRFSADAASPIHIFETGGIKSMADTAILFIFTFALFGMFERCGITEAVLEPLLKWADRSWKGNLVTVLAGFLTNLISASAMCSFIFTISCLSPVYAKKGWDRLSLVRASFVGCLYTSLWIPWHSNIVTPSALMGVEDIQVSALMLVPALILLSYLLTEALLRKYGRHSIK